jgi:hypothetical protein
MLDGIEVAGRACHAVESTSFKADRGSGCVALQPQPYVIASHRDDARLMEEIDRALDQLASDGTLDAAAATWLAGR